MAGARQPLWRLHWLYTRYYITFPHYPGATKPPGPTLKIWRRNANPRDGAALPSLLRPAVELRVVAA